jgi:hypothetical protein
MKKTTTKKRPNKKLTQLLKLDIKEIATGITSEKLSAMFFDATKLKNQPEPLYRLDSSGHRYYYRFDEQGEPVFYTSVTTMIRNTMPTSPHLIQWLVDKGGDNGKDEAEERAHYGTFLHVQCASLLINGTYDLDKLQGLLQIYLTTNNIPQDRIKWADELKKDVLAFAQFMIDTNCKPLAIEICLWHPIDGYAGAIDIVCEMDLVEKGFFGETYLSGANKGQPKESKQVRRIRAIIDIKSGRKGFYESHEIQLKAYTEMWNIHFPDTVIDKTFNWSPKEWRTTPSYNLKDQTDSRNAQKLPHLVELARIEDSKRDNKLTIVKGNIDLVKGLAENIEELTFIELIKKNK